MMDVTVALASAISINKIRSAKTIRNVLRDGLFQNEETVIIRCHLWKFRQNRMAHWGLFLSPYVCNIPKRLTKVL